MPISNRVNSNYITMPSESEEVKEKQEKYLRELTCCFRGIEKPLATLPPVESLDDLIHKLHDAFSTVSVNMYLVNHLMLSYKSKASEWQKFAKWNRSRYTRNLVDVGNGKFNLLILCWPPDHGSAIHDHADSHCFMKMLQGELVEVKYAMPKPDNDENGGEQNGGGGHNEHQTQTNGNDDVSDGEELNKDDLIETGVMSIQEGNVAYINDNIGLHRVENRSHADGAVSLHLYCPPFQMCSVFPSGTTKKVNSPVTFYSKYGVREEQA